MTDDDDTARNGLRPGVAARRQPRQRLPAGDGALVRRRSRERAATASSAIDGVVTMTDAGSPLPFCEPGGARAADRPTSTRVVDAAPRRSTTRGAGGPFLLDSAWPTPDLRAARLRADGPSAAHGAAGRRAAARRAGRAADRRASTTTATAADLERTLVDGYPAPQLQPFERGARCSRRGALDAPGWHHFVGYVDDRPVAAGSALRRRPARCASRTSRRSPTARGRGYGLAITAATIAVDLDEAGDARSRATSAARSTSGSASSRCSRVDVLARDALTGARGQTPNFGGRARSRPRRRSPSSVTTAASLRPDMNSASSPGSPVIATGAPSLVDRPSRARRACAA